MPLILLLFIVLPLLELYILIRVGTMIGALSTILLSMLSAAIGVWLVRSQGFGILRRIGVLVDRGDVPTLELMEGALLLLAGCCLLFPGFLTDILGLLLLIPPLRQWLMVRYVRTRQIPAGEGSMPREPPRVVIEGEYRRED